MSLGVTSTEDLASARPANVADELLQVLSIISGEARKGNMKAVISGLDKMAVGITAVGELIDAYEANRNARSVAGDPERFVM
jgi:hypothetical protein